jgi:hypothetical protein
LALAATGNGDMQGEDGDISDDDDILMMVTVCMYLVIAMGWRRQLVRLW